MLQVIALSPHTTPVIAIAVTIVMSAAAAVIRFCSPMVGYSSAVSEQSGCSSELRAAAVMARSPTSRWSHVHYI